VTAAATAERSVADVLRAARERISDPERWGVGVHARDTSGAEVEDCEALPKACEWCALGALFAEGVQPYGDDEGFSEEDAALGAEATEFLTRGADGEWPPTVNDEGDHARVLDMYDRAIELAEAEG
jgi:hypothetical protein